MVVDYEDLYRHCQGYHAGISFDGLLIERIERRKRGMTARKAAKRITLSSGYPSIGRGQREKRLCDTAHVYSKP